MWLEVGSALVCEMCGFSEQSHTRIQRCNAVKAQRGISWSEDKGICNAIINSNA